MSDVETTSQEEAEVTQEVETTTETKPEPKGDGTEGLKSALVKERQAAKDLKQQLKEAQSAIAEFETTKAKLAEVESEIGTYKERETRANAIKTAVAKVREDGKEIDSAKLEKLAERFQLEGIDEALADAAEAMAREVKVETSTAPTVNGRPFKGQPSSEAKDPGEISANELYDTDRDAFDVAISARLAKAPFMAKR